MMSLELILLFTLKYIFKISAIIIDNNLRKIILLIKVYALTMFIILLSILHNYSFVVLYIKKKK